MIIPANPLLSGFNAKETSQVLTALKSTSKSYTKGTYIFREGENIHQAGIVTSGCIALRRTNFDNSTTIINTYKKGEIFAEYYANLNEPLVFDFVALETSGVILLDFSMLFDPENSKYSWYDKLIVNLFKISAKTNTLMLQKNLHITHKQIRHRVMSYLTTISVSTGLKEFNIPFDRQEMADYLAVDRSALSGELGKMQADGLISFKKNHFKLLI